MKRILTYLAVILVLILAEMATDAGKIPSGIAAAAPKFFLPGAQQPAQNRPMAAYRTKPVAPKAQIYLGKN